MTLIFWFFPDEHLNTLSLSQLGLKIVLMKLILFNVLMTMLMWKKKKVSMLGGVRKHLSENSWIASAAMNAPSLWNSCLCIYPHLFCLPAVKSLHTIFTHPSSALFVHKNFFFLWRHFSLLFLHPSLPLPAFIHQISPLTCLQLGKFDDYWLLYKS